MALGRGVSKLELRVDSPAGERGVLGDRDGCLGHSPQGSRPLAGALNPSPLTSLSPHASAPTHVPVCSPPHSHSQGSGNPHDGDPGAQLLTQRIQEAAVSQARQGVRRREELPRLEGRRLGSGLGARAQTGLARLRGRCPAAVQAGIGWDSSCWEASPLSTAG